MTEKQSTIAVVDNAVPVGSDSGPF